MVVSNYRVKIKCYCVKNKKLVEYFNYNLVIVNFFFRIFILK